MTEHDAQRERGLEMMSRVYGWTLPVVEGAFVESTVDHLFGEVWANGSMSVRDRRLLLIGLLVAGGDPDVLAIQFGSALALGKMTPDELREMVLLIAHYAGWPKAAKVNNLAEAAIAKQQSQDT